jgi:hypothetical protein
MANLSFGLQSVPANTGANSTTPSLIATHVGGHTVRIDPLALRRLIDALKAALRGRN